MTQLSDQGERFQVSRTPAPPAVAEQREALGEVTRALASLPPNQQEVLRLKFQNDFTYRQIAGITGLSVSHVGVLIHKGLTTLRKQFKAAGLIGQA